MRPIIGITFSENIEDDPSNNYINAIKEFGGIPRTLYPGVSEDAYADIDALLLTGGGDIHPDNFDAEWHPTLKYVNEDRDALEIPLCQEAIAADIPVFGICRGVQIMSVAMGGSLYQDIPSEFPKKASRQAQVKGVDARHTIEIVADSRLNRITGKGTDKVNSAHHQAVREKGEGFEVTARTKEGIIEAMENRSKRFVLGVQYHPERMIETVDFQEHRRKLFEAFIKKASKYQCSKMGRLLKIGD
jgi:putative glutamine amidotransferase